MLGFLSVFFFFFFFFFGGGGGVCVCVCVNILVFPIDAIWWIVSIKNMMHLTQDRRKPRCTNLSGFNMQMDGVSLAGMRGVDWVSAVVLKFNGCTV